MLLIIYWQPITNNEHEKPYNQDGFLSTLFAAVLIIAIATATEYFDSLFVHDTGHIKIFGDIGVVLASALYYLGLSL